MPNPRRRYYILTEDKEPVLVDETTWGNWPGRNLGHDLVGFTEIDDEVEVRTEFFGVDEGYFPGRPPALFETEVYGLHFDRGREWQYCTWAEAEKGHERAVSRARHMNRIINEVVAASSTTGRAQAGTGVLSQARPKSVFDRLMKWARERRQKWTRARTLRRLVRAGLITFVKDEGEPK
jgi:hypothetical protein